MPFNDLRRPYQPTGRKHFAVLLDPDSLGRVLPDGLEATLMKALGPEPVHRPATIAARPARITSHASAMFMPAPTAGPLTAASDSRGLTDAEQLMASAGLPVRALGVMAAERSSALPDVPTMAEQGHPELLSSTWFALLAPKGTPADVVRKLSAAIDQAARYIPLEQLCLSPQCGFSSTEEGNELTIDDQIAKLRLIVETAREVWG